MFRFLSIRPVFFIAVLALSPVYQIASAFDSENILKDLEREDKWFLEGTNAILWAPPFPAWPDAPGYWDHACIFDLKIEPIFTWTLIGENGREIPLKKIQRVWRPGLLTQTYHADPMLTVTEYRWISQPDTLTSFITLLNSGAKPVNLKVIQWTSQSAGKKGSGMRHLEKIEKTDNAVSFEYLYHKDQKELTQVALDFIADRPRSGVCVNLIDGVRQAPIWTYTTLCEKVLTYKKLPEEWNTTGGPENNREDSVLYAAQQYDLHIAPGKIESLALGCLLTCTQTQNLRTQQWSRSFRPTLEEPATRWRDYLNGVPAFHCSDPIIERYYWYRWYGLRLNRIDVGIERLPYPCVFEGINEGWFRHNISYSAQVHMLDLRWMHDPATAMGSLLNFLRNQSSDGSLPGGIRPFPIEKNDGFYHGNWGKGVRQIYRIHRSEDFLKQVYDGLAKYAEYFDRARDKEHSHLYDVIDQWETGQEFMSRYQAVYSKADRGDKFQLKGVDATTYMYDLQSNLAWMAEKLGKNSEVSKWKQKARETKRAMQEKMWDPKSKMFNDLNPKDFQRTGVKTAVDFYPFGTDLVSAKFLPAIYDHLLNPNEFWTPYPLPSTSMDDPLYSAYGEWKNRQTHCPWNGRAWLMTGSHVCEALAESAQRWDAALAPKAAEMIRNFITMLYLDGDPKRPSSYEYYNAINGAAPYFRGTEDYMHCYIIDLIIQYVVGLHPQDDTVMIQPLPFGLEYYELHNVQIDGHNLDVVWRCKKIDAEPLGLTVYVNGKVKAQRQDLGKLILKLPVNEYSVSR